MVELGINCCGLKLAFNVDKRNLHDSIAKTTIVRTLSFLYQQCIDELFYA